MSTQISYIPEKGVRPVATLGGTDQNVPVIRLGEVTVQFLSTDRPEAIAYLTELAEQAKALVDRLTKSQEDPA